MQLLWLLTLLLVISCTPQETRTCDETLDQLGVRNAHGIFFDSGSERIAFVGGADHAQVCDGTWAWDGGRWLSLGAIGPSARTFPAMAQNRETGEVFLYGGNSVLYGAKTLLADRAKVDSTLGDFWTWDGSQWRQPLEGDPPPGQRSQAALAFDSVRRRLVLFGGYRLVGGEVTELGDTWEWDGRSWSQISTIGPPAQNGASMAFDESRSVAVLIGRVDDGARGATWEWDGTAWTRVPTADSDPRYDTALAYDPVSERLVRFGGWTGEGRASDTWAYDGEAWQVISESGGPAARNHTAMAYDPIGRRLVLFGGHEGDYVFGDLWALEDGGWARLHEREPVLRIRNDH